MDSTAVLLLCLEQEHKSLEAHSCGFLYLQSLPNFPDCSLCSSYLASMNKQTKAQLPSVGPWESFTKFVEWVLVYNGSPYNVCPTEEELTGCAPTETSHPPESKPTGIFLEPIAARGDQPTMMDKPEPRNRFEGATALEPVPQYESGQVREPATPWIGKGV